MDNNAKTIWATLSAVDVSEHVEQKGKLSYLSWAWAWGVMMDHYPNLTLEWDPTLYEPDGSATVGVWGDIDGVRRYMWLPVMNHKNDAIPNPTSRHISDARMRCMVKLFALYGLGHYIYAGEDIPSGDSNRPAGDEPAIGKEDLAALKALIEEVGADEAKFAKYLNVAALSELPAAHVPRARKALESKRKAQKEAA